MLERKGHQATRLRQHDNEELLFFNLEKSTEHISQINGQSPLHTELNLLL